MERMKRAELRSTVCVIDITSDADIPLPATSPTAKVVGCIGSGDEVIEITADL